MSTESLVETSKVDHLSGCRVCVVSLGLIGSSLAAALKASKGVAEVVGYARKAKTVEEALRRNIIDRGSDQLSVALNGADIVCVAAPISALADIFRELRALLPRDCAICDVSSVKQGVLDVLHAVYGCVPAQFVAAHPIAGSDQSGLSACNPKLFVDRVTVLTPQPDTDPDALAKIEAMWRLAGGRIRHMDAGRHDLILAATSHLPHLIAFAFMAVLGDSEDEDWIDLAGSGLFDFTRIAGSSPPMWRDITLSNRQALIGLNKSFIERLKVLQAALEDGDETTLSQCLDKGHAVRRRLG